MRTVFYFVGVMMLLPNGGCDRAKSASLQGNRYRVAVEKVADSDDLVVRKLTIETASRREFVLSRSSGRDSVSFGPSMMSDEKTAVAVITLSASRAEFTDKNQPAMLSVHMIVETNNAKASSRRSIVVPDTKLGELIHETIPAGECASGTTIWKIATDKEILEVRIE